ncbi:MAG: NADH:ubiquinone oxidoreductase [Lentisphaerae bacterium]|nr:NADH:ubiquinone oxidoreductase [Lentisphaerota bacterium]
MTPTTKPTLSVYWASSCGGCEIALANLHEKILDVDAHFTLFFCPCLLDTKKSDVEAVPDGSLDITLFNGAVRTSENEEMAHLLRRKSKILIATGACACGGGIPALANIQAPASFFETIYRQNPTIDNPGNVVPRPSTAVNEGTLAIPAFFDRVRTLAQTVDVDYIMPGCPPEPKQLWAVIELIVQGKPLPPKGSVIGAGQSSVCEECERKRSEDRKITRLFRTYELVPEPEKCLLEQGIVCMGPATRDGCGGLCPNVNMPCIGCYGPPAGIVDQGAKMAALLGSLMDIEPLKELDEEAIFKRTRGTVSTLPDVAGTFYKFSMAGSMLRQAASPREGGQAR